MNRMLRWRLSATLILSIRVAVAVDTNSSWSVHVWQSDDGLPNNNVSGLAQTSDGYLWIASPGRLARFDGVQFSGFSVRDFGPDENQRASVLCRSRDGSLWLAMTHAMVIRLNGGTRQIFTNDLPNQLAETITEDGEGAIWIVYRSRFICRIKDNKVTRFTQDNLPGYGCSLAADKNGHLWFGKEGQIGLIRGDNFNILFRLDRARTRVAAASDGGLWICLGSRLFKYSETGGLKGLGTFDPENPRTEATVLLEDHTGAVWIGTSDRGLRRYNGTEFENIPISHREILSMLEDQEGNLWVGTGGGGLNRVGPRAVELQGQENGQPFEAIRSICEDTNGTQWAATQTGSLVRRVNGRWMTVSGQPDWPGGRANSVTADNAGAVWIGTSDFALHRWRDGHFESWRRENGLAGHTIHALLSSKEGDLWLGEEAPDIIQRLHAGKLETFTCPEGTRIIRTMAEDSAGDIWAGTSGGMLLRIANGQVTDETAHTAGRLLAPRCLLPMPDSSLWIGYAGGGIGCWKNGRFGRITAEQGLYDANISQLLADGLGWIWCGADHGIFRVRQQQLEDAAESLDARVHCIRYGRDSGLPSLQANYGDSPSALRSADGRLWMPMRSALAVVDPRNIRESSNPPPVRLERVVVDDRPVAIYGGVMPVKDSLGLHDPKLRLRVPPGHFHIEFDFTALSFSAPENVRFRYQLKGFDDRWVETSDRRAAYSRLASGDYEFRVAGCSSDGVWGQPGEAMAFVVTPFFWQTWWFRLGALAMLIGIVRYVSVRRLQLKLQLLEQQAAIDQERGRIAKDLHDDLGTRLTKIVLLSGLAQRDRAAPEKTGEHMEKIASATRDVIKSLDETVWAVNPRNDTLPHLIDYIGQFAVEFLQAANIRCRLEFPEHPPDCPVPAGIRHNLFLAVKEALNNIVRHAQASEVRIQIATGDGSLEVRIEDNGRGFGPLPDDAEADGLRNMRQRMEEVAGNCRVESKPGAGTRISFACPWRNGG